MFVELFETLQDVVEFGEYHAIKPVPEVVPTNPYNSQQKPSGSLEYYGGKKQVKPKADFAKMMQDELDKNKHMEFSDKPQVVDS